jgi:hypothetical protein
MCVDDHSRLTYIELLADEKDATSNCFLLRTVGWFERYSVTITLVMTANGRWLRALPFPDHLP